MAKKEANITPLSTMVGGGSIFTVQGKDYQVKPLKIKEKTEFDALNFGSQYFTLSDAKELEKMNIFMDRYLFDSSGGAMTVEKCGIDDWDIVDLKNFLKKVIEISG